MLYVNDLLRRSSLQVIAALLPTGTVCGDPDRLVPIEENADILLSEEISRLKLLD